MLERTSENQKKHLKILFIPRSRGTALPPSPLSRKPVGHTRSFSKKDLNTAAAYFRSITIVMDGQDLVPILVSWEETANRKYGKFQCPRALWDPCPFLLPAEGTFERTPGFSRECWSIALPKGGNPWGFTSTPGNWTVIIRKSTPLSFVTFGIIMGCRPPERSSNSSFRH